MEELLRVDTEGWRAEVPLIREYYAKFGDRLPQALADQAETLGTAPGLSERSAAGLAHLPELAVVALHDPRRVRGAAPRHVGQPAERGQHRHGGVALGQRERR